jgi:hypothetical protein
MCEKNLLRKYILRTVVVRHDMAATMVCEQLHRRTATGKGNLRAEHYANWREFSHSVAD